MSVTQSYGANIAFIEELYEKYRTNPESVPATWREFFKDYEPEVEEEVAVASGGGQAPSPVLLLQTPFQTRPLPEFCWKLASLKGKTRRLPRSRTTGGRRATCGSEASAA